jgi:hypothetical protein
MRHCIVAVASRHWGDYAPRNLAAKFATQNIRATQNYTISAG